MSKEEALKLALEALGWTDEWRPQGLREDAITALRKALAQPEQTPYITLPPSTPMWTIPPRREWVGLESEEIRKAKHHIVDGAYHYSFKQGALWAEAKLKKENT